MGRPRFLRDILPFVGPGKALTRQRIKHEGQRVRGAGGYGGSPHPVAGIGWLPPLCAE
jgi:hypothetical protein